MSLRIYVTPTGTCIGNVRVYYRRVSRRVRRDERRVATIACFFGVPKKKNLNKKTIKIQGKPATRDVSRRAEYVTRVIVCVRAPVRPRLFFLSSLSSIVTPFLGTAYWTIGTESPGDRSSAETPEERNAARTRFEKKVKLVF